MWGMKILIINLSRDLNNVKTDCLKFLHTLQVIMHFNRLKDQFVENLDQPCILSIHS